MRASILPTHDKIPGTSATYSCKLKVGLALTHGRVKILGEWAKTNNIYPDILKIDAEGAELAILSTSSEMLANIKLIIIEMGESGCASDGSIDRKSVV